MPHVIAEYTANLDGPLDIQSFCEHLLSAATEIDALPTAGIRVRAVKVDHYAIADGNPKHGFIDISLRMRAGRSETVKAEIADRMFAAATDFTRDYMASHSLALSLEIRDIDADLAPKSSTVRDHLKGTA